MLSTEYFLLRNLLKGNYIKGANALESLLQESEQDDYLTKSADAMRVIFEPMTSGGNKLLPDIFLNNSRHIGQGLRTYARLYEPYFDPMGILLPFATIPDIVADTHALIVALGDDHISSLFLSDIALIESLFATNDSIDNMISDTSFLNAIATSSIVADMAMKKDYFVAQMLNSQQALDILIENDIFMARAESNDRFAEFFTSPLLKTTILKYATIRRYVANSAVVQLLAGDVSYFSTILNDATASSNIFTVAAASTPLIRNAVLTTAILAHDVALTKIFDNFAAVGTTIINDTQVQQQLFANSAAFWRKMFEYASVQTYIVSTNGGTFKDRIAASSLLQTYTYTVRSARGVKRSGDIYYLSARVTATNGSGTSTHYQGLGSDSNNTSVFTLSPGNMTTMAWTNGFCVR